MAELIDREAFLKRFTSEYRCKFTFGEAKILNVMFEELKKEPATTEAEIRAKAIDEFAEKLKEELCERAGEIRTEGIRHMAILTLDSAIDIIQEIAEQLKEE